MLDDYLNSIDESLKLLSKGKGLLDEETKYEICLSNHYLKLAIEDLIEYEKTNDSNFIFGAQNILENIIPYFIEQIEESNELVDLYRKKIEETAGALNKRIELMLELRKYNKQLQDYYSL